MKKKGISGEPFQLLIGIIVMGMAMMTGFYLLSEVNKWRCEQTILSEAIDFREKLSDVAGASSGTVRTDVIEMPPCVEDFYLKQIKEPGKNACEYLCPEHPVQCWVTVVEIEGKGRRVDCIDMPGDIDVISTQTLITRTTSGDSMVKDAFSFRAASDIVFSIRKEGNKIVIGPA